jgi:hypothetical protein
MLEMQIVMRAVLTRRELWPAGEVEHARRRNITIMPARGARTVLRERASESAASLP